jgi:hypothetical protein
MKKDSIDARAMNSLCRRELAPSLAFIRLPPSATHLLHYGNFEYPWQPFVSSEPRLIVTLVGEELGI